MVYSLPILNKVPYDLYFARPACRPFDVVKIWCQNGPFRCCPTFPRSSARKWCVPCCNSIRPTRKLFPARTPRGTRLCPTRTSGRGTVWNTHGCGRTVRVALSFVSLRGVRHSLLILAQSSQFLLLDLLLATTRRYTLQHDLGRIWLPP